MHLENQIYLVKMELELTLRIINFDFRQIEFRELIVVT
jgi:hypothetical protein